MRDRIINCLDGTRHIARARRVQHTQAHQTRPPHHTGNSNCVVPLRRDDTGDDRAVPLLVTDHVAARHPVPTVRVVNEIVAVVVLPVLCISTVYPLVAA